MEIILKHLEIILKEMCSRVNANYDEIDFKEDNWYWKYEWTLEEEELFIKWLINYLINNKEARKELLNINWRKRAWTVKAARQFVLIYGWKTKQNINGTTSLQESKE